MTTILWNQQDISALVTSVTVDQNLTAAGREARITAIYAPADSRFSRLNPACGDAVAVTAENKALFSGKIERVEWDSDDLLLTMVCLEVSALLAKNEIYRTFSGTAKEIATALCQSCGLTPGQLWDKPGSLFIPPSCGRTLFSILRQAYDDQCVTESLGDALVVRPTGVQTYQLHTGAVFSLHAAQHCAEVVSGAEIISARGDTLASAEHSQWAAAYGPRRRVYALNGQQGQAQDQALACLSGPARTGQITLPGDPDIPCGALVIPEAGQYGLQGEYLIQRVLHRLEEGVFTTTIGMVNL